MIDPYYDDGQVTLYCADNRTIMLSLGNVDAIVTDPPYGETSLEWDRTPPPDWIGFAALMGVDSLWCFGSMRFWLAMASEFQSFGWKYAQEIVWEKHNGSGFHADRFKRVHEFATQWYRGKWGDIYKRPQFTMDATARTTRRKARPPHMGNIESSAYTSVDGGPRLMRSVLRVRSEHGRALHPTQKPLDIVLPLLAYSVPPGGLVLDPFAGAGSTLVAARDLGMRAIGIEVSEQYCAATVGRLRQVAA